MWTTNSMSLYVIVEIILKNGLVGYYEKESGFTTDINKAYRFQNNSQFKKMGVVLPEDTASHSLLRIVVNDSDDTVVERS